MFSKKCLNIILGLISMILVSAVYFEMVSKSFIGSQQILWSCHVMMFILFLGFIFENKRLIDLGYLLLVPGNFYFAFVVISGNLISYISLISHIVGLLIGLHGACKSRINYKSIIDSTILLVVLFVVSKKFTLQTLNINLAHFPPYFVRSFGINHTQFMISIYLITVLMLLITIAVTNKFSQKSIQI